MGNLITAGFLTLFLLPPSPKAGLAGNTYSVSGISKGHEAYFSLTMCNHPTTAPISSCLGNLCSQKSSSCPKGTQAGEQSCWWATARTRSYRQCPCLKVHARLIAQWWFSPTQSIAPGLATECSSGLMELLHEEATNHLHRPVAAAPSCK